MLKVCDRCGCVKKELEKSPYMQPAVSKGSKNVHQNE